MKLRTVDGALQTLELLAERGRIGVRDVASTLDCSRSSAYRIVRTLQDRGWVGEAEPGSYELGPFALVLGSRALQRLSLRDIALPSMRRLVGLTEETVTVSVLVAAERVCVDQLESPRQVRMTVQVGRPYPLYAGASGKAILMGMAPETLDRYLARGVTIRALASDGSVTRASARRALSNGDASEVQLLGGAQVVREASGAGPQIEFDSEFLHAFLNTERLKSHLPVRLRQGASDLRVGAIDYDNLTRIARLGAPVRARFDAPRR